MGPMIKQGTKNLDTRIECILSSDKEAKYLCDLE